MSIYHGHAIAHHFFSERLDLVDAARRAQPRSTRPPGSPPQSDGASGADEVNITGTWRGQWNAQMDGIVANNRTVSMSCEAYSVEVSFSQTGNAISGTMRALGGGMCRVDGADVGASTAAAPTPVEGEVDGNTINWAGSGCEYTASLSIEGDRITGSGSCTDSQRPGFRGELTFTMTLNR